MRHKSKAFSWAASVIMACRLGPYKEDRFAAPFVERAMDHQSLSEEYADLVSSELKQVCIDMEKDLAELYELTDKGRKAKGAMVRLKTNIYQFRQLSNDNAALQLL